MAQSTFYCAWSSCCELENPHWLFDYCIFLARGQLVNEDGDRFLYAVYPTGVQNQERYEAIGQVVNYTTYSIRFWLFQFLVYRVLDIQLYWVLDIQLYWVLDIQLYWVLGFCVNCNQVQAQNKKGILPVATLSIALYVLRRSMSASDFAPEVAILSSAL